MQKQNKQAEWQRASTAPEGVAIETKIDDVNGVRNVTFLVRRGKMWWFPDGSMYVYYVPTHWRHGVCRDLVGEVKKLLEGNILSHLTFAQLSRLVYNIIREIRDRNPVGINFYINNLRAGADDLMSISKGEIGNPTAERGPRETK